MSENQEHNEIQDQYGGMWRFHWSVEENMKTYGELITDSSQSQKRIEFSSPYPEEH